VELKVRGAGKTGSVGNGAKNGRLKDCKTDKIVSETKVSWRSDCETLHCIVLRDRLEIREASQLNSKNLKRARN